MMIYMLFLPHFVGQDDSVRIYVQKFSISIILFLIKRVLW